MFNPSFLANYFKRLTMIDDKRETVGAALKSLGYSADSEDDAELDEAKQILLDQKTYLYGYVGASDYIPALISG